METLFSVLHQQTVMGPATLSPGSQGDVEPRVQIIYYLTQGKINYEIVPDSQERSIEILTKLKTCKQSKH